MEETPSPRTALPNQQPLPNLDDPRRKEERKNEASKQADSNHPS